jgi:hypothetical protein
MPLGPVELLVVKFPGNQFTGEIAPALAELVESNTIRIIDLIFARKDADGALTILEINDMDDEVFNAFGDVVGDELDGFLTEEDVVQLMQVLETNTSAALMLFENVWATRFRDAVLNANGQLVLSERIPHSVIAELEAA